MTPGKPVGPAMRLRWKISLWLLGLALLATAVMFLHAVATGVAVPYPDPTPEQASQEAVHRSVSGLLFMTAGVLWLAAVLAGSISGVMSLFRGPRRSIGATFRPG